MVDMYIEFIEKVEEGQLLEELKELESYQVFIAAITYYIVELEKKSIKTKKKEREKIEKDIRKTVTEILLNKVENVEKIMIEAVDDLEGYYYKSSVKNNKGSGRKAFRDGLSITEKRKVIFKKIDGKRVDERLLKYSAELLVDINREIKKAVIERKPADIAHGINRKVSVFNNKVRRLKKTEMTRVWNEAVVLIAEKKNVEKYIFNATMDSKTTDGCMKLNGKIIKKDELNRYTPPLHYNCRSLLMPVYE